MKVDPTTLDKLGYARVQDALAERARTSFGMDALGQLAPDLPEAEVAAAFERTAEIIAGGDLSLGGIHDIRPLLARVAEGDMLDGPEIMEIAWTLDAAGAVKRGIARSDRPALNAVAERMSTFDGALRLVREQLDTDGKVRDDATPKLREIRRRLTPLRARIRDRLQQIISRAGNAIQDPIVTLRRERYVIPVKASFQSQVPGIVLDSSDSGATVFVEPQSVVPMNNELALLEVEERDEVRRILVALGQRLAYEPGLAETLHAITVLDVAQASAALARDWDLVRPVFAPGRVSLPGARHPFVENVVPNSIELDGDTRLLIVTGPNAGGKTVLIKTLGLAALMAHSGLYVATAVGSAPVLPRFERLLVDIGDEQSIEASLSTYAAHLVNLKRIAEAASEHVLVLIDELGSGTDPAEGAALSQAILETVLARRALGLVTTHLAPLKVFASETPGVMNAAMRFDVERLRPAFELVPGQPGRSYALAIAERLGLSAAMLDRAGEILGPEGERLESLLVTLERQREELAELLAEAEESREQALAEAALLRQQIERLRTNEERLMAEAAGKAEEMLRRSVQQARGLRKTAAEGGEQRSAALEELDRLRKAAGQRQRTAAPARGGQPHADTPRRGPVLEPGARVAVASYGAEGQVLELRDEEVVVQLGLLRVTVPRGDVKVLASEPPRRQREPVVPGSRRFEDELNIRGERVEPALEKLREYLEEAHSLKRSSVRVLHGKGTGALRDAVRRMLRDDRRVADFSYAAPYEGGDGVTVVALKV